MGLAVATAVFAGTSLYLWSQLSDERARAAQVLKTSRELQARVVELEKARGGFNSLRMANAGGVITGRTGSSGPIGPAPAAASPSADTETSQGHPVWKLGAAGNSPAFQKMLRSQTRAFIRRQYAGVGETLGLSKEKTTQLIQLLADQQLDGNLIAAEFPKGAATQPDYDQRQREHEAALADLIGPDKAQALKEYQESIPARMEADGLARQLEDNGAALSDAQKKQLLAVVIKERARVPMPEYVEGNDQSEYTRSVDAWRNDYQEHIANEAGDFLSAEQLSTYNEIQQLQKDMREQFAAMSAANPPGPNRVVGPGKVVSYTSAAPVYIEGTIVNAGVASSAEEPEKK